MRIALTGNPNSGKTTMYNALTGRNERVGNWAGVTVDKKESPIKKSYCGEAENLIAVDLPGAYSMSPFTSEESITSGYVKNENPDVIINIVDATNLSRSLFFTTQLLEVGIPVVVALNKSDVNEKKDTKIDANALSEKLGCPVINTVSTSADGLSEVVKAAVEVSGKGQNAPYVQGDIDLTDKSAVEAADRKRFQFVNGIVKTVETRKVLTKEKNINDKIDAVLTNPFAGIPIFVVVMFLVFYISQTTLGTWLAEGVEIFGVSIPGLVTLIEMFGEWVAGLVENAHPLLQTIIVDGIIGGVGAVVGFLPLVMVMYFLIALLEDCGYMARVSVVLDPIFKRVGLSGKSVIPLVIGTGCAIPGIMACRTIRDEREKRATAMLTPFIPCGAKIPVIALFAGAFFGNAWWVSATMYFVGILLVLFGGLLVKAITGYKYRKSFFIIELPEYKAPSLKRAFISMLSRGKDYIVKAGTIILVCNAVVTIMANFSWSFQLVEDADKSILASIASPFAVILIPLGFGVWQMAAAAITGFIAKEEVVGTLASVYGFSAFIGEELEILEGGSNEVKLAMTGITAVAALAYLMFNLYTPPCFAAIGAMNSEIKSKKWLFGGIALQFGTGYVVAFLVYQIGTLIVDHKLGTGFVPGLIAVLAMVAILVVVTITSRSKLAKEYALKK
ncbi:MAG: ferrous iron transporter B [Lachnospiraceae bacterium]|nr:ferrous iron transporter B [Lachnospiraceae bacterium]